MVSYIWISVYSIVVVTGFLKHLITPLYRVSEVSSYTVFHRAVLSCAFRVANTIDGGIIGVS